MTWFPQLREALHGYYDPARPADIVGYLRGNGSQAQWRQMATSLPPHHQMLILGNLEPTPEEWSAAGVGQRGAQFTVTAPMLGGGFIVLYGGFMLRPWGQIHIISQDAMNLGFPGSLRSWRANYAPPRPRA